MKFSLIICTYMRPKPLINLLQSVQGQTLYPDEILIIDGSTNQETELVLKENPFNNLHYFLVPSAHRGITKQRNYGIERVGNEIEIVCFLDDDTELVANYFEEIIRTFKCDLNISGVGGVAINENRWSLIKSNKKYNKYYYFQLDGYVYKEGQRNVVRNYLGLQSNVGPGRIPDYFHGKTCGFPLNGKTYEVDVIIGMSFAFRKKVFNSIRFSSYFEGYGLYEDADFCIRALQFGKNVINTKAQLKHYHNPSGRPNQYEYGKMVVRNGWYVWRIKNPMPSPKAQLKWHSITLLLAFIRLLNTFSTNKKRAAFSEAIGRAVGWWSLFWSKPKNTESGFRMIKQVQLLFKDKKLDILPLEDNWYKIPIHIPAQYQSSAFDVEITFQDSIAEFRNSDYQWIDSDQDHIAIHLAPKILKLSNGFFVQPNTTIGIWEYNSKHKNKITWKFNDSAASALTAYKSISKRKFSCHKYSNPIALQMNGESFALLFSKEGAIEFSRSKIPFSAVACFTDHCDFDTLENVKLQRRLLKDSGVRITKGFFLKHFSKRDDGVSWQNNAEELKQWLEDGHELAYHSLSQSIMSKLESASEFINFNPIENVVTWIDHGYQPYNFSLVENSKIISRDVFFEKFKSSNITNIWNYTDSGVSTIGVINQLNASQFTLDKYWVGVGKSNFLNKIQRFLKNVFYHYYAENNLIGHYKLVSHNFKNIIFNYKLKEISDLFQNSFRVLIPVLKIILFWNRSKNKTYRFAKYNSIVFPYVENEKKFTMFQTLDMLDLKTSLAPENIDLLSKEKGLFIGHTYFSVPMKYHQGRMFLAEGTLDEKVVENFMYLGQKIKNKEMWNPTLNELLLFLSHFQEVVLDVDDHGHISVIGDTNLPYRTVN